jgi:leucyl-tRNA synthetase
VKKVTEDFEKLAFNTAIAQLMIFVNDIYKAKEVYKPYLVGLIKLIYPIAPHLGEELYSSLSDVDTITYESWPTYDPSKLVVNEVEIAIQVNGKLRATMKAPLNESKEVIEKMALSLENVQRFLEGVTIRRIIVVANKIVNIVVS